MAARRLERIGPGLAMGMLDVIVVEMAPVDVVVVVRLLAVLVAVLVVVAGVLAVLTAPLSVTVAPDDFAFFCIFIVAKRLAMDVVLGMCFAAVTIGVVLADPGVEVGDGDELAAGAGTGTVGLGPGVGAVDGGCTCFAVLAAVMASALRVVSLSVKRLDTARGLATVTDVVVVETVIEVVQGVDADVTAVAAGVVPVCGGVAGRMGGLGAPASRPPMAPMAGSKSLERVRIAAFRSITLLATVLVRALRSLHVPSLDRDLESLLVMEGAAAAAVAVTALGDGVAMLSGTWELGGVLLGEVAVLGRGGVLLGLATICGLCGALTGVATTWGRGGALLGLGAIVLRGGVLLWGFACFPPAGAATWSTRGRCGAVLGAATATACGSRGALLEFCSMVGCWGASDGFAFLFLSTRLPIRVISAMLGSKSSAETARQK